MREVWDGAGAFNVVYISAAPVARGGARAKYVGLQAKQALTMLHVPYILVPFTY